MIIAKKLFLSFIVIQTIVWLIIPMVLIYTQPDRPISTKSKLSFEALTKQPNTPLPELKHLASNSGEKLAYREFPTTNNKAPLVVLVHGSSWHSIGMHHLAHTLASQGVAHVITPDLRGHGFNPIRRGDIDYIGQLEDDLAELIEAKRQPNQKILLAGHSSGGGLAIRFAAGKHANLLDGSILLAPYLHHSSPTMREKAGNWSYAMVRRIIGLSMQNMVGIKWFNDTPVMRFNHQANVLEGPLGKTATETYSYRLWKSMHPRDDYTKDISALPRFLLLVGSQDDAFNPEKFEPTMQAHTNRGTYSVLSDIDHATILTDTKAAQQVADFIKTF